MYRHLPIAAALDDAQSWLSASHAPNFELIENSKNTVSIKS
jgi:hypothetical protein